MRKVIVSALMIPLLLLAGCGGREAKPEQSFHDFREAVLSAQKITVDAHLTADYGDSVEEYALSAVYDGSETTVTVTEPLLIAGVTARSRWGETEIEYGDVLIGMGQLDENGLSPAAALPVIFEAMAGGYTELLWWDGDLLAARLYAGEDSRCTVWLDPDTLIPTAAEIASNGRRVISCELTDWIIQ